MRRMIETGAWKSVLTACDRSLILWIRPEPMLDFLLATLASGPWVGVTASDSGCDSYLVLVGEGLGLITYFFCCYRDTMFH